MDIRVGLWRKLSAEELMLLNCGVGADLRVPWTARRSNQSILKEISPGCSLEGLTDPEALILWPPDAKSWLIGKDPDARRDWGQEEKGMTEDEVARWHHRLDGHEFESTPGVGDGQGGLVCYDSWGRKGSDTTEQLNWTVLNSLSTLLLLLNHSTDTTQSSPGSIQGHNFQPVFFSRFLGNSRTSPAVVYYKFQV